MQGYIDQAPYYCQSFSAPLPYRLYYCFPQLADLPGLMKSLSKLDGSAVNRIARFDRDSDKLNTLLGRLLLGQAIKDYYLPVNIKQLSYSNVGKPILPGLCFSLAHCDGLIILACSENIELGVDCEPYANLELSDYHACFCDLEWQSIWQATDKLRRFYQLWTRKEALLKACGCGLHDKLNEIDVQADEIGFMKRSWQFIELELSLQHIAHICLAINIDTKNISHS